MANDIFKSICWCKLYLYTISMKFGPVDLHNNILALVCIMPWSKDKSLSEPMMALCTDAYIYVARLCWVTHIGLNKLVNIFADNIFRCMSLLAHYSILIQITIMVSRGRLATIQATLLQVMTLPRIVNKSLPWPMMLQFAVCRRILLHTAFQKHLASRKSRRS